MQLTAYFPGALLHDLQAIVTAIPRQHDPRIKTLPIVRYLKYQPIGVVVQVDPNPLCLRVPDCVVNGLLCNQCQLFSYCRYGWPGFPVQRDLDPSPILTQMILDSTQQRWKLDIFRPVPTEYSVRVVAVAVAGQRLIPFSGR